MGQPAIGGQKKARAGQRKRRPLRAATPLANGHLNARELGLLSQIQQAFSIDLLNKGMQDVVDPYEHYTRGHCYVATEAFYYLYGKKAGYEPRGRDYHWWLEHGETGQIVDPTEPQLSGPHDYTEPKSKGFLPQSPKHATKELMRRVRAIQKRPGQRWSA